MNNDHNHTRRFSGVIRLYGEQNYQRFRKSHICVIGLGGVGSWAVEALARHGIGEITLIDLDHVSESNINRQLHALDSSLGQPKAVALDNRVRDINPECITNVIEEFISEENLSQLLHSDYDYVIDCIDDFRTKAHVVYYCKRNKIKVITTGGAGGRRDPSKIRVIDLSRSNGDVLLSRVRKELRETHGYTRNPKRRFNIPCVFSDEPPRYPSGDGNTCTDKRSADISSGLNCASGLGSSVNVTASFALIATAHVLNKLSSPC